MTVCSELKWGDLYRDEAGTLTKFFPLHDGQKKALASKARFTAVISGSGSGKSALVPLFCMRIVEANPKAEIIVVSPNFKMLNRTVLEAIKTCFEGTQYQGEHIDRKGVYEVPCGARIYLYSADNSQSIEGVHADAAIIDEAGQMNRTIWEVVRRRTNKKAAPILITSTPYSLNWLYYDVYAPWQDGNKEFNVITFPSTANPTYSLEEFEAERKRLPDWRFRMMYLGEFTRPSGLVYPDMQSCLIDKSELPSPEGKMLIGGLDFGYNDPNAALAGFVDDNILYLCYERYLRFKTVREFAADLPKQILWFCDSSRPDSIKELRRDGYKARPCKKYAGSVKEGIDHVTELIKSGRLKIVKGAVKALLTEADLYAYLQSTEKEGEYSDSPMDTNNHSLDSLSYLVQGARRLRLISGEKDT